MQQEKKDLNFNMTDQVVEKEIKKEEAPAEKQGADNTARDAKMQKNFRTKKQRKPREKRERSEFDQQMLEIRRVTRVMAGGRRFSFSVTMVVGDRKGKVGVGLGKAGDVPLAIEKGIRDAQKKMLTVKRTKTNSIAHDVSAKEGSAQVVIIPSPERGVVAGSAVRTVLEFAGVNDVIAKIHTRSKGKLSLARATISALKKL